MSVLSQFSRFPRLVLGHSCSNFFIPINPNFSLPKIFKKNSGNILFSMGFSRLLVCFEGYFFLISPFR